MGGSGLFCLTLHIFPQNFLIIFACSWGSLVGSSVMCSRRETSGVFIDGMRWLTLSVTFLCFLLMDW